MRVALLSPLFESVPPRLYGGTERVVDWLSRGLIAAGHEVTLFASGDSRPHPGVELVAPIEKGIRLQNPPIQDALALHYRMMAMVGAQAGDFDIIHSHVDYWMLPLSLMKQTPLVTTFHCRLDSHDLALAASAFPDAAFTSVSDSQRTPLPGLNWVGTVRHGIPIEEMRFHPNPGSYLAFLGRIFPDKRPEWAIEIAHRSGVPLKIAAKIEGPQSQAYFDSCIRPHVDGKNVEYVGEISESEKNDFLGKALALVFPIDWPEPFGLVMIESLACGTPVLARPFGAVPEVLRSGLTGFVDADIRELAQRVRDLDRISRARCRSWVEERFSIRRMTEDYIDVYRSLLGSRRARPRLVAG